MGTRQSRSTKCTSTIMQTVLHDQDDLGEGAARKVELEPTE